MASRTATLLKPTQSKNRAGIFKPGYLSVETSPSGDTRTVVKLPVKSQEDRDIDAFSAFFDYVNEAEKRALAGDEFALHSLCALSMVKDRHL